MCYKCHFTNKFNSCAHGYLFILQNTFIDTLVAQNSTKYQNACVERKHVCNVSLTFVLGFHPSVRNLRIAGEFAEPPLLMKTLAVGGLSVIYLTTYKDYQPSAMIYRESRYTQVIQLPSARIIHSLMSNMHNMCIIIYLF